MVSLPDLFSLILRVGYLGSGKLESFEADNSAFPCNISFNATNRLLYVLDTSYLQGYIDLYCHLLLYLFHHLDRSILYYEEKNSGNQR